MAAEASLAMSVKDNLSAAIVSMRNGMTAFRMDASELGKELERLNSAKVSLKLELSQATEAAKKAQKTFHDLGKSGADAAEQAAAEAEWRKAEEQLENVRQQYNLVSQQAKETTKQLENVTGAISKAENRAGSSSGSGGLLSALSKAGLMDIVGDSMGQLANTAIGSMFGSEAGGLISGALSGALSGAAMGSLAGPVGTAIGAAIGGASGLISSGTQAFQARDEAFKGYYQDLYQTNSAATVDSISSGSGIAAGRETDLISFTTMFKDADTAKNYLAGLVDMANTTPFLYDDLTAMSKTLATYKYDAESILPVLQNIGDAGAALGMDVSDMSAVATSLGRMNSSDKASLEYLNILNDRGIGAVNYLAEAKGVSVGTTYDMISKGQISGTEAVEIILNEMEKDFHGAMKEQSQTFSGLTSTLEGLKQEVDNAAGEGYNQERLQGLNDEITAYSGELGEAMSNLNTISGQTQALLDNLKDQYQREALSAVLLGDQGGELFAGEDRALLDQLRAEYVAAEAAYEESVRETGKGNLEAGLKMEALKEETIALATAAYDSSQEVQTLQSVEQEQIAATRELAAAFSGWSNSYRLEQELSKGQAAALKQDDYYAAQIGKGPVTTRGSGHAYGLDRVPYDNYPALLHEGERVLTASQAREQDQNTAVPSYMIETSSDYDPTWAFLGDEIMGYSHAYSLDRVPYDDYPALLHEGERVLTASQAREQDQNTAAPVIQITVSGNTFGAGMDETAVAQALADQIALQLQAGGGR